MKETKRKMDKIILASASPRRKELLKLITENFEVCPDNSPEDTGDRVLPEEIVSLLSAQKCFNVADKFSDNSIIIGADTVVSYGEKVLGKPKTKEEAKDMLNLLSGKRHSVYTGVTVTKKSLNKAITFYEKTDVYFYDIKDEIERYVETCEPMDKAGAYGIQEKGGLFVKKVCGDFSNVVGLPVGRLYKILKEEFNFRY